MIYIQTDQGKIDIFSTIKNIDRQTNETHEKQKSHNNYVICMTARSGSTMLCSLLKKTNLLGLPDEYINPRGVMQLYLKRFPSENIFDYFDKLRRNQISPNGVFGMKTNLPDFRVLINNSLVGKLLKPVKFIYLDRNDIILQAISVYLASKTGIWHLKNNQVNEFKTDIDDIDFDEQKILEIMERLIVQRLEWEKFFNLYSIEPLRITYEKVLKMSIKPYNKLVIF